MQVGSHVFDAIVAPRAVAANLALQSVLASPVQGLPAHLAILGPVRRGPLAGRLANASGLAT